MPKIAKEFKWSNNQKSGVEYNDINEVQHLIKKHEFIFNPENEVMNKVKAEMGNIVKNSNGMLKGVYLFKDHGTFGDGKQYPKRERNPDKKRKINPEDKAIFVGGNHVGYLISNVPWLNPNTWKGLGLKLETIPV